MDKKEARRILTDWLESSKGTEEQLGYIEGWFDKRDEQAFRMAIEALNEQPTGKWINEGEDGHGFWVGICNQCGKENHVNNYCGYCGAKMG